MHYLAKALLTIALVAVLLVPSSHAYPKPRDDFGDGGFFGSEPNPPEIQPPDFTVPDAELGKVLELILSGLEAGDRVTTTLGEGTAILSILDSNAMQLDVVNGDLVKRLELPPVPPGDVGDVTMLITPASISVDRIGDNPINRNYAGEVEASEIKDASFIVWGAVTDISTTAANPTGRIAKPDHVTATTELHDLLPATDAITDMILLDPDDLLQVGTLADHTLQVPLTDDLAVDQASIQSALNTAALTDLSIDGVLAGLKQSVKEIGAVDVEALSLAMVDSEYALRRVSLPSPDPATILDKDAGELILVDGGLGKITAIAGKKSLAFDADLLTQLKDPESIKDTVVQYLSTDPLDNTKKLGIAFFHPSLGNYGTLLERAKPLLQNGMVLDFVPSTHDCKTKSATKMEAGLPTLCTGPDLPPVPINNVRLLDYLGRIDKDGAMAKITGAIGAAKPPVVGTPNGLLPDMPHPDPDLPSLGGFGFSPDLPSIKGLSLATFELPDAGLGSLPGVDTWTLDEPSLPDVSPDPNWPDVSGIDPTLLHGIFEAWDAGMLAGLASVVPLDAATSAFGAVTDLATGNAIMALPQTVLQSLPIGTTSELTLRFVGESGSVFSNTGIEGVRVQLTQTDPMGLSTTTTSHDSNLNGYVVAPINSLGTWSFVASHEDYQDANGGGQAPPPGKSTGQEMTMKANSDNAVKDFAVSNSSWLVLLLIFVVLVAVNHKRIGEIIRNKKGKKRGGRRPPTQAYLVALVLLFIGLAGCADSGPSQKGDKVEDLATLKDMHIKADCTFTANAQANGLHADLDECKMVLVEGPIDEASVVFSGNDDNTRSFLKPDRKASISTIVYYPDGDNSIPVSVEYNADNGEVEQFTAVILAPTDAGFGKYQLAFSIEQFQDSRKFFRFAVGVEEKPDPHDPDPVRVTFTAGKESFWGSS